MTIQSSISTSSFLICSDDDFHVFYSSDIRIDYVICLDTKSVGTLYDAGVSAETIYWLDIETSFRQNPDLSLSSDAFINSHSCLLSDEYYQGIYASTMRNTEKLLLYLQNLRIDTLYISLPSTLSFDSRGHIPDIFKFLLIEKSIHSTVDLVLIRNEYIFSEELGSLFLSFKKSILSTCSFLFSLSRLVFFFIFRRASFILLGSGIPVAEKAFRDVPAFRLDYFQNQHLTGIYKKYFRSLDISTKYKLDIPCLSESKRLSCHSEYIMRLSMLIQRYSYTVHWNARLYAIFFGSVPELRIGLSDNLSFFTYLMISYYHKHLHNANLCFIPHSMARRETLWSQLFQVELPYYPARHASSPAVHPSGSECHLEFNANPVFVCYSYSHCKRGVVKFNPVLFDDVFLLLRSIDDSSKFYISRKPGSEPLHIHSDIVKSPTDVRFLQSDIQVSPISAAYILAIGHWGQIHSIRLSEGCAVLYFGADIEQVPFRSIPIRYLSSADGARSCFRLPHDSVNNLNAWLILS